MHSSSRKEGCETPAGHAPSLTFGVISSPNRGDDSRAPVDTVIDEWLPDASEIANCGHISRTYLLGWIVERVPGQWFAE